MFKRLKRNKNEKQWEQFREWYQIHEQAKQFTFMKCHFCAFPASSPEANFCSHCGASFHPVPSQHHDTEPLQAAVGEPRPYEPSHRQMQQMISEQDTQQVSAARPVGIKRTVRIPRLERLA